MLLFLYDCFNVFVMKLLRHLKFPTLTTQYALPNLNPKSRSTHFTTSRKASNYQSQSHGHTRVSYLYACSYTMPILRHAITFEYKLNQQPIKQSDVPPPLCRYFNYTLGLWPRSDQFAFLWAIVCGATGKITHQAKETIQCENLQPSHTVAQLHYRGTV